MENRLALGGGPPELCAFEIDDAWSARVLGGIWLAGVRPVVCDVRTNESYTLRARCVDVDVICVVVYRHHNFFFR